MAVDVSIWTTKEGEQRVPHNQDTAGVDCYFVVGQFPPPVQGFTVATESVARILECSGVPVVRVNLTPLRPSNILQRLRLRLAQIVRLAEGANRRSVVYVAISGGKRQIADATFLFIARLRGARILVHHHSFAYLDVRSRLTAFLCRTAGADALHITLCSFMAEKLRTVYQEVRDIRVVSNAGLRNVGLEFRARQSVETIGYFSAVTRAKGVVEFLNVAQSVLAIHPQLRFAISGPCDDAELGRQIEEVCMAYPQITYSGPAYGEEKQRFLESLDVLLFPTTYRNEAEPIAILEALSAGIPVVAWERGCISSLLSEGGAEPQTVVPRSSPYVLPAAALIDAWIARPDSYREASRQARRLFDQAASRAAQSIAAVFQGDRRC